MAGIYRAVVKLRAASGKTEDDVVNTWHFLTDPDIATEQTKAERIRDIVRDVYHTDGEPDRMESLINDTIARGDNVHEIAITRRPDVYINAKGNEAWGPPDFIYGLTFWNAFKPAGSLPNQVAGVLSFHASYGDLSEEDGATRPRARRRGKVYFGPLATAAMEGSPAVLSDLFRTRCAAAAQRLLDASNGNLDEVHWATYSSTLHEAHRVVGGMVNNAIDIQRRRGQDETARTLFGVAG